MMTLWIPRNFHAFFFFFFWFPVNSYKFGWIRNGYFRKESFTALIRPPQKRVLIFSGCVKVDRNKVARILRNLMKTDAQHPCKNRPLDDISHSIHFTCGRLRNKDYKDAFQILIEFHWKHVFEKSHFEATGLHGSILNDTPNSPNAFPWFETFTFLLIRVCLLIHIKRPYFWVCAWCYVGFGLWSGQRRLQACQTLRSTVASRQTRRS